MTPLDGAINSFQYTRALFRHQVTSFFFLSLLSFFFLWLIHTNATAIHRCFVTRPCAYFDDDRCNIYIFKNDQKMMMMIIIISFDFNLDSIHYCSSSLINSTKMMIHQSVVVVLIIIIQ